MENLGSQVDIIGSRSWHVAGTGLWKGQWVCVFLKTLKTWWFENYSWKVYCIWFLFSTEIFEGYYWRKFPVFFFLRCLNFGFPKDGCNLVEANRRIWMQLFSGWWSCYGFEARLSSFPSWKICCWRSSYVKWQTFKKSFVFHSKTFWVFCLVGSRNRWGEIGPKND